MCQTCQGMLDLFTFLTEHQSVTSLVKARQIYKFMQYSKWCNEYQTLRVTKLRKFDSQFQNKII